MKNWTLVFVLAFGLQSKAQITNKEFNRNTEYGTHLKNSVRVNGNSLQIDTKVIFNALPDGYHITYTYSSISSNVDQLELITEKKTANLKSEIKKLKLKEKDMVVDAISIDPFFGFVPDSARSITPSGYKSTHNITFNIKDISQIDELSRICFTHEIYDIIDIVPYLNNTKFIEDSLASKSLEILSFKKTIAQDIGYIISDGKIYFDKKRNTIYPSERYLKSYIANNQLYRHHISQNSTISYNRKVDIDAYYNLDLRDADYVFNAHETKPVIQFVYTISYGYIQRDREEEARLKEERDLAEKKKKEIYILDKNGKMKQVTF